MAQASGVLSKSERDRIYEVIRRDALDGIAPATRRTAVFVAGQPGAGRAYAAEQVRAHLAINAGSSVAISGDALRQYHPHFRSRASVDLTAGEATRNDIEDWFGRLTKDATAQGANLVLQTSLLHVQDALDVAARLKGSNYEVAAVVLATDRDQSRQATMAGYDQARAAGLTPVFVAAAAHDTAYDAVRTLLGRIEADVAVDRVQLIVADGRQLYANEAASSRWARPPHAVQVLDDFRERKRTPREMADSALRWQTVVQRLATDATVPREVASQAVVWRNEATQAAEQDAEASRLLAWGREAEAFRTMNRKQFLSDFPQYAKAVERMDEALRYAERNFEKMVDRERFLALTRERLATRIAEGRFASPERVAERGGRAR